MGRPQEDCGTRYGAWVAAAQDLTLSSESTPYPTEVLWLLAEVLVAVGATDLGDMLVVGGLTLRVAREGIRFYAELRCHVGSYNSGHVGRVSKERTEKAYRAELKGKA